MLDALGLRAHASLMDGVGALYEAEAAHLGELELEVAKLRDEVIALRQCIHAMQTLAEAASTPVSDAQLLPMLQRMLEAVMHSVGAEDGSLMVLDEDTHELVFVASHGTLPREHLAWRRVPPGEGVAGWVVENRRATVVNDAQLDDRFYPALDQALNFRTHSLIAVPMISGDTVLGVIEVLNKPDGRLFNLGDQALLTLVCRFAGALLDSVIKRGGTPSVGEGATETAD